MKFSDIELILKPIFVFKKQTKNLNFLRKFFLLGLLATVLSAQLFFVVFSNPKTAQAFTRQRFDQGEGFYPDDLNSGNCPMNSMPAIFTAEISKKPDSSGKLGKIGTEDTVVFNTKIEPSTGPRGSGDPQQEQIKAAVQKNCVKKAVDGGVNFNLTILAANFAGTELYNKTFQGIKVNETTIGVGFPQVKLNLPPGELDPVGLIIRFSASLNGEHPRDSYIVISDGQLVPGKGDPDDPSVTPLGNAGSGGDPTTRRKLVDIKITSTGLDKYRVLQDETKAEFKQIKFGSGGVGAISSKWASPENTLTQRQEFELPSSADYVGPSFTPVFFNMDFGINYASKIEKNFVGCEHGRFLSDTCGTVFLTGITPKLGATSSTYASLPQTNIDPTIYEAAWKDTAQWKNVAASPGKGKPLGTVEFAYVPVIWGTQSVFSASQALSRDLAIAINKDPLKFTIEVYKTEDDLKAACIADGLAEEICNSETGRRYKVGKEITTTSGTTETPAANAGQSLYSFLVRLIADLLILLQTLLYRIFALIIVPVIKAILSVHPYEDVFVNIIYPGWLILRNLANIFFIVALLVTGLKILFQQSASGTARGFIVKLILAALLVNFSLVISQGVVGIADTVQSQFLPENSRVIEALGSKLMVEPLKQFRASAVGDTGYFEASTTDKSMADIIKPFVLFFLSLASFCSFIAIAGFLLVRLVALWLLYMTSPIAYVGSLMNESQSMASKWWKEFIKYASITPILAFFLNIAALMATLFANSNNSLFTTNKDGTLSGDAVVGTLTIVTHFIVVGVIFAGMKFASSSGVWGAQKIVDAAQKIPLGVKDFFADTAARGLEKYGGRLGGKAARALTAVAKPVDFARAIKKNQLDTRGEEQKKRFGERLDTLTARTPDTKKLGSSLKKAREKMKDFEGDDAPYLSEEFGSGYKKGDKDLTTAALLKMGQEGHFKDMLEKAEELTGNKYSKDAAGLSAMTEDLVNNRAISESNRRDLLNEFDKSAKKKRKTAHYAGNVSYNKTEKKFEARGRKVAPNNKDKTGAGSLPDEFNEGAYAKDSWVMGQIKGRLGDDNRGSLRADLTQADTGASVVQGPDGNFKFTMAQAGVFAAQENSVLSDDKVWKNLRENNVDKYKEMKKVFESDEGRKTLRTNMVQYLTEAKGMDSATALSEANSKLSLIENGLRLNHGETGGTGGGQERQQREIGFRANHNAPQPAAGDDDDDDIDDDEPTARANSNPQTPPPPPTTPSTGGSARPYEVTMKNETTVMGGGSSVPTNPVTEQPAASPPEAPLFSNNVEASPSPQVGSSYSLNDSQNNTSTGSKPKNNKNKRTPGFTSPSKF